MSFWKWLFGKSRLSPGREQGERGERPSDDGPSLEQHLDYLNSLRLPAIALSPTDGPVLSRIGGLPSLPDGVPWPEWNGKPLAFLCQFDLSEIPNYCDRNGLPQTGMLYFFYAQDQDTWGGDPKDKGSWRVIYAAAAVNGAPRPAPAALDKHCVFEEKPVAFVSVETYPDWQDDRVEALGLSDKQSDQYFDLCANVFKDVPAHHLFGYPAPVQDNDMDLDCQLVANGIDLGGPAGFQDPRRKELEPGRRDWILLLQLDTDDDTHMMWGDAGMLYFWIRKQDLQARRFDRCWMILQCG
ncbi:MAG: YwqG family protein [Candidatus Sumerlaeia bacterium]